MLSVLVVDDDFRVARIHARFVEQTEGFSVAGSVRTGAEALTAVEKLEPDLVLLDVHLPDIGGLDVLGELRARGDTVGVIVITAEREVEVVQEALHRGAAHYLIKPFEYADLHARLEHFRDSIAGLASGPTDQASVDRAFGQPVGSTRSEMPKGFSVESRDLVLGILTDHGEVSAAECGELAGMSRVTARRYLEYFVTQRRVLVRQQYGSAGRPERRYRLAQDR